jgi:hypothetical protein
MAAGQGDHQKEFVLADLQKLRYCQMILICV